MPNTEQEKQTGEKAEIRAVGWMNGRQSRQREKGPKEKTNNGWREQQEGVGKTIRRMVRGKNNRQQEGQEDGRETEIADRQERSKGEKPKGLRRRTKGRPQCRKRKKMRTWESAINKVYLVRNSSLQ